MKHEIIITNCSFCGQRTLAPANEKVPACNDCEEGFLMPMIEESFEIEETYYPLTESGMCAEAAA